ncbi:MAG: LysE family transporter [Ignavibacteriales bacterium]|nr:LysE family transporter [Ignavibacteriales bacterium]MBK7378104.1 LysE family transporter [Ignavibacteriales bacterium]
MTIAFINLILIGFFAGFLFSIPVAGPINIIITSNALGGRLRYCLRTAIGSSIIEFFYVMIIVYGISALYNLYQPLIPYLLFFGSIILILVGLRMLKMKLNFDNVDTEKVISDKIKNKGGMRTGIFVNLTNPSLFLGWLTSTFIIFSFVSSIGINTGGLDLLVNKNLNTFQEITGNTKDEINSPPLTSDIQEQSTSETESLHPLLLSSVYSISVAFGSFVWLFLYSKTVVKYRNKFKIEFLNFTIKLLSYVLISIGIYLIYKALTTFIIS